MKEGQQCTQRALYKCTVRMSERAGSVTPLFENPVEPAPRGLACFRVGSGTQGMAFVMQCRLLGGTLVLHLLAEEEVERGADHRNGGELADAVPGRGHGGREDVRGKLQFQRQRQVAGERQADGHEAAFAMASRRDRVPQQADNGDDRANGNHRGPQRLNPQAQPLDVALHPALHLRKKGGVFQMSSPLSTSAPGQVPCVAARGTENPPASLSMTRTSVSGWQRSVSSQQRVHPAV